MITKESIMEVDSGIYLNYINDRFKSMFKEIVDQKAIFLYLSPLATPTAGGSSYTIPLNNKHCIIFGSNLDHPPSYAHEIAHTLGLDHTFREEKDASGNLITVNQAISNRTNKVNEDQQKIIESTNKITTNKTYGNNAVALKNIEVLNSNIKVYKKNISNYEDGKIVLRNNNKKFEFSKTENFMDYKNTKISFYKWQWNVMQEETKKYYNQ